MKNNIILFIRRFCIIFTFTIITYSLFSAFNKREDYFQLITLECIGLAIVFNFVLILLDYLSNKIKILATNHFIWIQYIILISIIIIWANIFNWGDWSNKIYISIFILVFTFIYLFIYFFIGLYNKEEDIIINEKLKKYQKNM